MILVVGTKISRTKISEGSAHRRSRLGATMRNQVGTWQDHFDEKQLIELEPWWNMRNKTHIHTHTHQTCKFSPSQSEISLGGGFKYFLFSPRSLGKWSNLTCAYFSNGLVQPPTRSVLSEVWSQLFSPPRPFFAFSVLIAMQLRTWRLGDFDWSTGKTGKTYWLNGNWHRKRSVWGKNSLELSQVWGKGTGAPHWEVLRWQFFFP